MSQETRALSAEELIEKVIPGTYMSKASIERQMFRKIQTDENLYVSYSDILYVIANSSIRSYFEGKSAPELSPSGVPRMAERLGEPLPDSSAVANKAKSKKKAPAKKKAVAKTTPKPL